ncbi:MAG: hypothetical protein M3347_09165 [Armatimonadota bacterium]|nr:hypothetical protein [Armatimonadota bacterium]
MKRRLRPFIIACALLAPALTSLSAHAGQVVLRQPFDGAGGASYQVAATGRNEGHAPRIVDGALRLLDGAADVSNVVVFERVATGRHRRIEATWKMRLLPGADGVAFVLLDTARYGTQGVPDFHGLQEWEEPNLPRAFAVAFDIYNPPTNDPFNADGNIHDRPQREVSLHWDGAEIANRLSPVEFRGEALQNIGVTLEFVTGGAEVSVRVGETLVYEGYFIPELLPLENRVAMAARSGAVTTTCDLKDLSVVYEQEITPAAPPLSIRAIDQQIIDAQHARQSRLVDFPDNTDAFGRIVLTLTLGKPPAGFDPWDRKAAIYVYDEQGQRFEIVRFITPYRRGFTWKVDVSDYRPLLMSRKKVEVWCETYGPGWLVTVDFDFYPGPSDDKAYKVENVWVGEPEIGNPEKPVASFFTPKTISRDARAERIKLRFVVTGHGMSPNSRNAAEFMPSRRTVKLDEHAWDNVLWKTDNYLNPCRPQGGTWKYDRAGWAPGAVVPPWDIDITPALERGHSATLGYDIEPYINEDRGKTYAPTHWVESQAISYRR